MRSTMVASLIALVALCAAKAPGAELRVPEQHASLDAALAAAEDGDTVLLAAGLHRGNFVLARSITLRGAAREGTIITASSGNVLTVTGAATLEDLTVRGGDCGVFVDAGAKLIGRRLLIRDAREDGIGFRSGTRTRLDLRDSELTNCGDAIDLEGTQGVILRCHIHNNRDDAVDYDGDCSVLVAFCRLEHSGDDGIEIRLARRTHAILTGNVISANGEDGLELIDSPVSDRTHNLVAVDDNDFRSNARFGVGAVDHRDEESVDHRLKMTLYAGNNRFADNARADFSANYAREFQRSAQRPATLKFRWMSGDREREEELPLQRPSLLAIIDLAAPVAGPRAKDLEGVAVVGRRLLVADDDGHAILNVDLDTCHVVDSTATLPFAGTETECVGPEGLCLVEREGRQYMALSDDATNNVHLLDWRDGRIGALAATLDVGKIATRAEDVEFALGRIYLPFRYQYLAAGDVATLQPLAGFPVRYKFGDPPGHVAGVGFGDGKLWLTSAGYRGRNDRRHNERSLFFSADPNTGRVLGLWHLGPFSNDPRGIAFDQGLIYIADGMSPYQDSETGETERPGIKVFVFAPQATADNIDRFLSNLPRRMPPH